VAGLGERSVERQGCHTEGKEICLQCWRALVSEFLWCRMEFRMESSSRGPNGASRFVVYAVVREETQERRTAAARREAVLNNDVEQAANVGTPTNKSPQPAAS
jgi:hypothetical protein